MLKEKKPFVSESLTGQRHRPQKNDLTRAEPLVTDCSRTSTRCHGFPPLRNGLRATTVRLAWLPVRQGFLSLAAARHLQAGVHFRPRKAATDAAETRFRACAAPLRCQHAHLFQYVVGQRAAVSLHTAMGSRGSQRSGPLFSELLTHE